MAKAKVRGDRRSAIAKRLMRGDQGRDLSGQFQSVFDKSLFASLLAAAIQRRHRRYGCSQHVHRMAVLASVDHTQHRIGNFAVGFQLRIKLCKLVSGWQLSVDQQIANLFKGCMGGQIVNRIATINQLSFRAINVRHAGSLEINAF